MVTKQGAIFIFQVIRTPETSDETFNKLMEFSKNLKKTPVSCKVCFKVIILFIYKSWKIIGHVKTCVELLSLGYPRLHCESIVSSIHDGSRTVV